jgi:hypothetical protein
LYYFERRKEEAYPVIERIKLSHSPLEDARGHYVVGNGSSSQRERAWPIEGPVASATASSRHIPRRFISSPSKH